MRIEPHEARLDDARLPGAYPFGAAFGVRYERQGWRKCRKRRTTARMQEVEQRRSSCRAVFCRPPFAFKFHLRFWPLGIPRTMGIEPLLERGSMMRALLALTPSGPSSVFASNRMDGASAENAGRLHRCRRSASMDGCGTTPRMEEVENRVGNKRSRGRSSAFCARDIGTSMCGTTQDDCMDAGGRATQEQLPSSSRAVFCWPPCLRTTPPLLISLPLFDSHGCPAGAGAA